MDEDKRKFPWLSLVRAQALILTSRWEPNVQMPPQKFIFAHPFLLFPVSSSFSQGWAWKLWLLSHQLQMKKHLLIQKVPVEVPVWLGLVQVGSQAYTSTHLSGQAWLKVPCFPTQAYLIKEKELH